MAGVLDDRRERGGPTRVQRHPAGGFSVRRRQPPDRRICEATRAIQYLYDFRGNELSTTDEVGNTTTLHLRPSGPAGEDDVRRRNVHVAGIRRPRAAGIEDGRAREARRPTATSRGATARDRLTSVTDPLGRTTRMTYDGMSRKTSMHRRGREHQTSYVYDLRGHLIETDYPTGHVDARDLRRSRASDGEQGPDQSDDALRVRCRRAAHLGH